MKKRYFLLIFIVLFGLAIWGLVNTVEQSTPNLDPATN
jgi:hypothetical protein